MKELNKTGGPYGAHRRGRPRQGVDKTLQAAWRRRRWAAAAVGACVLLAGLFLAGVLGGDDEIRRNVHVGDLSLGGMTREEARQALTEQSSSAFGEVRLGETVVNGEDLGVSVAADSAVDEAYAVGRRGGIGQRASDFFGVYFGEGVNVTVEAGYDEAAARGVLEGLADDFNREPRDASFDVAESGRVEVQEAESGRVLDVDGTLANLDRTLAGMGNEVQIAERSSEPALTTEEARALAPTELLGEYKTDFAWDPDEGRQANLKKASGAVDNTLLAPGEVFSFTEQAGDLKYEDAKVFSGGGVAYEEGGGLCQVSSTLFMAANYAGLEIVERHQHYAELPYIQPGFDATVWFGAWQPLDMKFRNTTDGYLLVKEFVDEDGFLTAQILGQEPTGKKVTMNTEKVEQSPTEGIKWVTSKKVVGADGEVLFDDVMYESTYSYNPPVPEELKHETNDPRTSGWLDPTNTTGWAD